MPRFVILEHDWPYLHWDLMLEIGEQLRTWRLARTPAPGLVLDALPLPDHRRHYLDYEGPLSGNRGTVRRWDAGEFLPQEVAADHVTVLFQGNRLRGMASLRPDAMGSWTFLFTPLSSAKNDGTGQDVTS